MTTLTFKCGDNAELIKDIPSNSVQLVYFNPPYAITKKVWDIDLDWDSLFPEMWRVLKPNGAIIIHCSIPFTWRLIRQKWSKDLRYQYYWNKVSKTNFLNANYAPMRSIEDILVYYKKKPLFNFDKNPEFIRESTGEVQYNTGYYGNKTKCVKEDEKLPLTKYVRKCKYDVKKGSPIDLITMAKTKSDFTRPDDLMKFFVKTYTNNGDTVLDPTCGDARCAKICKMEGRSYIGFDIRDLGQQEYIDKI